MVLIRVTISEGLREKNRYDCKIADVDDVADLFAPPSLKLDPGATDKQREEQLATTINGFAPSQDGANPPPSLIDGGVQLSSGKGSNYAVEIQVRGNEGYVSQPLSDDAGLTFVDLSLQDIYGVKVYNRSPHFAAVTLTIDGINMFEFCEVPHYKQLGKLVIPPNKSYVIKGWYVRADRTDTFLVDDAAKATPAELKGLHSPEVGTISVKFAVAVPQGIPFPQDEATLRSLATTRGPSITGERFVDGQMKIGVTREVLSIRYNRPLPPSSNWRSFWIECQPVEGRIMDAQEFARRRFAFLFLALVMFSPLSAMAQKPRLVFDADGPVNVIRSIAFSPDSTRVYAAGMDKVVHTWEIREFGKELKRYDANHVQSLRWDVSRGLRGAIYTIATPRNPESPLLALAGYSANDASGDIVLYDVARSNMVAEFHRDPEHPDETVGHLATVSSLAFSPGGERLATFSKDGDLRVWAPGEKGWGQVAQLVKRHGGPELQHLVTFVSAGEHDVAASLVSRGRGYLVMFDSTGKARPQALAAVHRGEIRSLAAKPGENVLATGDTAGDIIVWRDGRPTPLRATATPPRSWPSVRETGCLPPPR